MNYLPTQKNLINKLQSEDFESIKNIIKFDCETERALKNYFLDDREIGHQLYGKFINNSLVATIGIIDNLEIPAWTLSRSCVSGSLVDLGDLIKFVIKIKEKEFKSQFFTLVTDEEFQYLKTILKSYQPYLEHKINCNELTGYENIDHDVLEYKTYEISMFIYLWVLKNEYRTF